MSEEETYLLLKYGRDTLEWIALAICDDSMAFKLTSKSQLKKLIDERAYPPMFDISIFYLYYGAKLGDKSKKNNEQIIEEELEDIVTTHFDGFYEFTRKLCEKHNEEWRVCIRNPDSPNFDPDWRNQYKQ